MISKKQISEIREHLENAQNPVFFFDNDQDGLCSFLLLQRAIGRGRGVPIKTFPEMDKGYFRKVREFGADCIFILDKPMISDEFFEEVEKNNIPVVWIDHHDIPERSVPKFVNFYNSFSSSNNFGVPVTAICYEISRRKEDSWLGIVGCVADHYLPNFYSDFLNEFPEMGIKTEDAFEVLYDSEIGKVARMLGFGLKDRLTNVIHMIRFLMDARGPHDVLQESKKNKAMHARFNFLFPKYEKVLKKAMSVGGKSNKLLFFEYSGEFSISSDLANELIYRFPKKYVVVAYLTGGKINISARGPNVKKIILDVIAEFENSSGGGHTDAVGAVIQKNDLEVFRERLKKNVQRL